jgi:hypothetical protein
MKNLCSKVSGCLKNFAGDVANSVKVVSRYVGLGAAGLAAAASLSGNADAGIISVRNNTTNSEVYKTDWYAKNIPGATEGKDGYDGTFISSPNTPVLQINSLVDGILLSTDARPVDTYGFPFDLSIKGSVNDVDNYLRYRATDTTDLVQGQVQMWDLANPDTKYELNLDGNWHNISLPNVTGSNKIYGNWYLQSREQSEDPTPEQPVPEPTALFGSALGLYALSKSRKRRE